MRRERYSKEKKLLHKTEPETKDMVHPRSMHIVKNAGVSTPATGVCVCVWLDSRT